MSTQPGLDNMRSFTIVLVLATCIMLAYANTVHAFCWIEEKEVAKGTVPVIVATLNSPFNGVAELTDKWTFYWEFGSLTLASVEYSITSTVRSYDGESVALVRSISISGIFRSKISISASRSVKYVMKQLPDCWIIHSVDYRGEYDNNKNKYPMIWAFYTLVSCLSQGYVNTLPEYELSEKLSVVLIRLPGRELVRISVQNCSESLPVCKLVKDIVNNISRKKIESQNLAEPTLISISKTKAVLIPIGYLKNPGKISRIQWIINGTKIIEKPYITLVKTDPKTTLHITIQLVTTDKHTYTYKLTVFGAKISS